MTEEEFREKYPALDGADFDKAARQIVLHVNDEYRNEIEQGDYSEQLKLAVEAIWAHSFARMLGAPVIRSMLCVPMSVGDPFTLEEVSKDAMAVTLKRIDKYMAAVRKAKERMGV